MTNGLTFDPMENTSGLIEWVQSYRLGYSSSVSILLDGSGFPSALYVLESDGSPTYTITEYRQGAANKITYQSSIVVERAYDYVFGADIPADVRPHAIVKRHTQKRGSGEVELLISELQDCVPSGEAMEDQSELFIITDIINMFLDELKPEPRALFVWRYWYAQSISELAGLTGYSESKIKSILHRLRCRLKQELEQEGVSL